MPNCAVLIYLVFERDTYHLKLHACPTTAPPDHITQHRGDGSTFDVAIRPRPCVCIPRRLPYPPMTQTCTRAGRSPTSRKRGSWRLYRTQARLPSSHQNWRKLICARGMHDIIHILLAMDHLAMDDESAPCSMLAVWLSLILRSMRVQRRPSRQLIPFRRGKRRRRG